MKAKMRAGKKFDSFSFLSPSMFNPIPIIKTPPTPVIIFTVCGVRSVFTKDAPIDNPP